MERGDVMYQDEQSQKYSFYPAVGINQAVDESLLQPGETSDGQNFCVRKGIYEVTAGNTKYVPVAVPGGCETLMAFYKNESDGYVSKTLLAASPTNIYKWTGSAWQSIMSGLTSGRFSFINYQKGMTEIVIMSNGSDPMMKWDGTTLSSVGGGAPKAKSITLHYERVWATGINGLPNTAKASKDMDPDFWDLTDPEGDDPLAPAGVEIDLPTWDGGVNIGLSNIFDDVVIFKTYSIWKIVGTYPGEYQVVRVFSASGAIAERSIVDGGTVCFFLAIDGIYAYNGNQADPISAKVEKIIKNMNPAYRDKAVGVFYDNRYILALPEGDSTENNCIVEYDILTQQWTVKRGFNVNSFLVFKDILLFSNNSGYVLEYDKGNDFDGKPIVAYWNTPRTTLGSTAKTISSTYFYADLENITPGGMKLKSDFDGKVVETLIPGPFKKGKRHRNKGRKFNLRIENVNGSRFRLRVPELHIDIDED